MAKKIEFRAKEGGGDFTLVPKGTYQFQITSVDTDQTDKEGNPQLKLEVEVAGGTAYDGQKIPMWITMDESFGWKLRQIADAAGVDYEVKDEEVDEKGKKIETIAMDAEELLSCYVQADLTHYEDKKKNRTYHNLANFQASPLQAQIDAGSNGASAPAEQPATAAPAAEAPRRRPRAGA